MEKQQRFRIITDGRKCWAAPKGVRLPAGIFEGGPRDSEGIRHVQGRFQVIFEYHRPSEFKAMLGVFPKNWL